jgi:hypothetical protein
MSPRRPPPNDGRLKRDAVAPSTPDETSPRLRLDGGSEPVSPTPRLRLGAFGLWHYETIDQDGAPVARAFGWSCGPG